jgi:uncharacterized membrane protein
MEMPFSISEPKALILLLSIPPVVVVGWLSARARPRDRLRIAVSTGLRSAILLLVVLALAGLHLVTSGGPLNVVFLIDESASVAPETREAAYQYVRQAIASMGPNDCAGVVLFGERAIVDRALSADTRWQHSGRHPAEVATNLADAMQVASALFPEGGARRLVLLSDGVQTVGSAEDVARRLGLVGIQISVVPLGVNAHNEVAVERVLNPTSLHVGEEYDVRVLLRSTSERVAVVSLYDGDQLVARQEVQLRAGDNVVEFRHKATQEGFRTLSASVTSVDDRYAQNNQLASFVIVKPPPKVLLVAGTPADAGPLKAALEASGVRADVVEPIAMPHEPDNLGQYDAVLLVNASAETVGIQGQQALQHYVRDMGRGLIMVGGELSYGAGGYLRSPLEEVLPVSMDVRTNEQRASIALTFVVDKSGSMGRCHCGGSQQFSPTMRTEFGVSKIEIVKQAIRKAVALLNSSDEVGVVAYDADPHWLVRLASMGTIGEDGLNARLQPLVAEGETDMHKGISAATIELGASNARLKHMIVLSDGWTRQSEFTDLLSAISARGITLSTIGVGEGPGDLLKELAEKGGGRYYHAEDVNELPDVVLKETVRLVGAYYVEQPFKPVVVNSSPILNGLDPNNLPPLLGYNSTTPKSTADVLIKSPQGDPILATWQYGLGRVAAWTSDAKGRWAAEWVGWSRFSQFAGQLVGWTLPRSATPGMETSFSTLAGSLPSTQDVLVRVESADSTGAPRNFLRSSVVITATNQIGAGSGVPPPAPAAGGGETFHAALVQQSPGVYEGVVRGLGEGAYEVYVQQLDPSTGRVVAVERTGLVVPYAGEYRLPTGVEVRAEALLSDVAGLGRGRRLDISNPAAAFTHDIPSQPVRLPLWPWLLLLALLLFPVDVAVRRLSLTRADLIEVLRAGRKAA